MKQFASGLIVVALLGAAVALAFHRNTTASSAAGTNVSTGDAGAAAVNVRREERNPWTHLNVNNRPKDFQFAIITDRTGGRRPGVFTRAVEKINLLQPEFVVSVGDLIEGYNEDPGMWALEWSEFESKIEQLQMPFFYCAGNHDITNLPMSDEWKRKFGRAHYHFTYRGVLFLVLNTEEKPAPYRKAPYFISPAQRRWAARVLQENRDARWTIVLLHKPAWTYPQDQQRLLGFSEIEEALRGRKYTVFAGHNHRYGRYVRNGREYYILATTGGATKPRLGFNEGYFDHFVWVTMKDDGPVIANLLLDGVWNRNIRNPAPPRPRKRKRAKKPAG